MRIDFFPKIVTVGVEAKIHYNLIKSLITSKQFICIIFFPFFSISDEIQNAQLINRGNKNRKFIHTTLQHATCTGTSTRHINILSFILIFRIIIYQYLRWKSHSWFFFCVDLVAMMQDVGQPNICINRAHTVAAANITKLVFYDFFFLFLCFLHTFFSQYFLLFKLIEIRREREKKNYNLIVLFA